jgi:hypothetical protein
LRSIPKTASVPVENLVKIFPEILGLWHWLAPTKTPQKELYRARQEKPTGRSLVAALARDDQIKLRRENQKTKNEKARSRNNRTAYERGV